jgi:hypothetical protein
VVVRVEAVVERDRAGAQLGEPVRVGGVGGHPLDRRVLRAAAVPGDDAHLLAALGQQLGGGGADGAGAGDDVQGHGVHLSN